MTKDEILEKGRSENKNMDIYDLETQNKAAKIGFLFGVTVMIILYALLIIVKNERHSELLMIFSGMEVVVFSYKYIKMKKKHELVVTILYSLLFLFFTADFILGFIR